MYYEFGNLNQAYIGLCQLLFEEGESRKTRGFDCIEYPNPILVRITNPSDNVITIKERRWARTLPFAESLWIASGTNHLGLVEKYAPGIVQYSDDNNYMRAAYGPRIRSYSGIINNYENRIPLDNGFKTCSVKNIDQLKFVIETLKRDINSRQALITIHDPGKDCYNLDGSLITTKDMPCCRTLQFLVNKGKLDCVLTIRSNDINFGFGAVNVFNFTWMQQYIATMLGLLVGDYYHFAANLHYYSDKQELTEIIASQSLYDFESKHGKFQYKDDFTLEDFDENIKKLFYYEEGLRTGQHEELLNWEFDTFRDWAAVFYKYWTKNKVEFVNPYLNDLFYGS